MVFVYLDFDVFVFDHLLVIVVFDHEPLSNDVFSSVFEDKGVPNIFLLPCKSNRHRTYR